MSKVLYCKSLLLAIELLAPRVRSVDTAESEAFSEVLPMEMEVELGSLGVSTVTESSFLASAGAPLDLSIVWSSRGVMSRVFLSKTLSSYFFCLAHH